MTTIDNVLLASIYGMLPFLTLELVRSSLTFSGAISIHVP